MLTRLKTVAVPEDHRQISTLACHVDLVVYHYRHVYMLYIIQIATLTWTPSQAGLVCHG